MSTITNLNTDLNTILNTDLNTNLNTNPLVTPNVLDDSITIDNRNIGLSVHNQFFRVTQAKDSPHHGNKRPDVKFTVPVLNATDVMYYIDTYPSEVLAVVNDALLQQAKALFAAKRDDWDYIPSPTECSLVTLGKALLTPPSSNQVMTNANLALFAEWYNRLAPAIWDVTESASRNGAKIITDRFKHHIGNMPVVQVMHQRLNNIPTEYLESMVETNPVLLEVLDSILTMLYNAMQTSLVSADDI